ncbi:hypothetical protein GCM10027448_26580 [Nocardioides dilutus]
MKFLGDWTVSFLHNFSTGASTSSPTLDLEGRALIDANESPELRQRFSGLYLWRDSTA